MLVDLIDEVVRRTHGIDRRTDPDRFAAVVGPRLGEFIATTSATNPTMTRRALADVVARIEEL